MSREFLDFVEDILEGMNKAKILLEGLAIPSAKQNFESILPLSEHLKLLAYSVKPDL